MSIHRHIRSFVIASFIGFTALAPALALAATPTKQKHTKHRHKISATSLRDQKNKRKHEQRERDERKKPAAPVIKKTSAPVKVVAPATAVPIVTPVFSPAPSTTQTSSVSSNTRSMWVWGSATKIVTDAQEQNDFFAFAQAPHGDASMRLNRVYFFGDSLNLNSGAPTVRAFLKRAHSAGIAVEYLTGDSDWALDGQGSNATARVDKMIAFNAGTTNAAERFDGIHFDIEPYLLSSWKANRARISQNYVNILRDSRAKIDASGQKLSLNVDIPTWYSASVPEIWNPLTAANTPVTGATIMNYFDTSATFLYGYGGNNTSGGIGPNLAKSNNLVLTFGAETMSIDPVSITFRQEGYASLGSVFSEAQQKFGNNLRFGGLAVHHYDTFRALK